MKMNGEFVRNGALALVSVSVVTVGVWMALCEQLPSAIHGKVFDRNLAEGVQIWNPKTGIASVQFDSCRMVKRRLGPVACGGFNVLCLAGLTLNLPFPKRLETENRKKGTGGGEVASDGALDLFRFSAMPLGRVSGLHVKGVAVNRIVERSIMPVFTAREMRSRGQMLQLSGCTVFADGRTNLVGKATLALKPSPVLAWQGGSLPLDDLLSSKERK